MRPLSSRYATKTAGVSFTPAAMPRAMPLPGAPGRRVRSQRIRQATARLIWPKSTVWKTGSSHRASAVAAQSAGSRVGRPARRQESRTTTASRATFPATKAALRTDSGSQASGTKRTAAKGGYVAGSCHSVTVNP